MKTTFTTLTLLLVPFLASAQNLSNFNRLLLDIGNLIDTAIPLLIAVAVLVFIFGVVKFILSAGNDEKRKEGIKFIVSGLIGIFVIVSLFGLVNILQKAFGTDDSNEIQNRDIPSIPGVNTGARR